ncbi:MAG: hydroxymethylbilane synthase [Planctomycetota bacterium]|nr:hydroxymethylbilane synthase [Planctomycetota bacterium]
MKDDTKLRLGTRASNLALTQSRLVAALLEKAHRGLKVEHVEITTTGDTVRDRPLQSFGGRGVFVKELENALLQGRVDVAVHSLKDLPTRQPRGLVLGAISGREDTRDVAVAGSGRKLEDLPPGSVIGTGSPRRRAQLKAKYPHLEFAEIRGNVETRLRKVQEGQYAGTILARAGLKRLGLLVSGIGFRISRRRVLHLRAALGLPDGSVMVRAEDSMPVPKARQLGRRVARTILARGGRELMARLPQA